ncbi:FAD-dependent oxidoreductase [Pseudomonas hunanensis]|uniref:Succinate dehydrogenase/fumarate reductase flavoprotein subunit n=1 Tax=Pseudomonas hunanensis TaxID=1247546 RepID=A0ACC6K5P9_9PSED|nr:FAD-dependent oxidoreductase [Pseudomonas hunanensis]MBP2261850.1 succinate dehydrogenase/fumarate reductase flavoprotein subunit [Pseudomonas sp. BP8]MDR6713735.1 succinate dehydrogenase/fumarate reductase flavoprotein subunit [Pseudomonas hunanensis]HDS1737115.1 FAD-dependent oxidoreductase [Pseudomonas putida]
MKHPSPTTRLDCDLLVIGSGASGLAAAVTAASQGLKVIVVEKHATFGGATAWSGGWLWVPGNPLAKRAGIHEDPQQPRTYLKHELGDRYDAERVEAFLHNAPRMVAFFEQNTAVQWLDGNGIPDIHGTVPGAASQGHQVIAAPYDAREMGPLIRRMRKTMKETSFLGMPIMAGADLGAFLSMTRSLKSFLHVSKRVLRHLRDLLLHGRAMHLVNGVALVARLAKSAVDLGVTLIESAPARKLITEQGRVLGAWVDTPDGPIEIHASKGVVLAAGGFPNDKARRKALFPRTPCDNDHLALPPVECSGDGISLGESAGGVLEVDVASPVAWAPVSLVRHADGSSGHFPHIIDRAKPGLIGVLSTGKRFVNEADGYYDYTAAMVAAAPEGEEVASWLICDHRFQRRFGLGYSRPFPLPVGPAVRSGYLQRGDSIEALAKACGIDPAGLVETVRTFNAHARRGEDPEFGRGSTPYNRKQGDPLVTVGNPCVAPIEHGPFYAVKVRPGSFGTFAGLKTNGHAQVLDARGAVIAGLYAVGTDMASVMGGFYPSGGINLGPAMTFGYVAGLHAAGAAV